MIFVPCTLDGMNLPSYWLSRPSPAPNAATLAAFDQLYDAILREAQASSSPVNIFYDLPAPKWQFLCHLADRHDLALHGSGDANIREFEPRQSSDVNEFGRQKAVYAAADGLWAMFFAIIDRSLPNLSISNACVRVQQDGQMGEPLYMFSVENSCLAQHPWRSGVVYLLPRAAFTNQAPITMGPLEVHIAQLASTQPVTPLAVLAVEPGDFPFLSQIRGHDGARLADYAAAMSTGAPWPDEPPVFAPPVVPLTNHFFTSTAGTRMTWLGMAGVAVNSRGTVVLIDPLLETFEQDGKTLSEAGFAADLPMPIQARQVPRADLVCYTHADHDHIGQLTAKALAQHTTCRFLAPPPVASILADLGIPPERIQLAHDFDAITAGGLEITVTPALHNWQEVNPWQRGDCCGYLLRTADGSLWHPGDTRLIDELYTFQDVDVLLLDVADVDSHLGPAGSAQLARTCGARVLIPYHYWTFGISPGPFADFHPQQLVESITGLDARLLPLLPGQVLFLPV
jgi:L-ascorbate metabolism protein UlaG (beta-lactamase superfamily)